jgi:hypothetical protein
VRIRKSVSTLLVFHLLFRINFTYVSTLLVY